jgi:hypothetical protein
MKHQCGIELSKRYIEEVAGSVYFIPIYMVNKYSIVVGCNQAAESRRGDEDSSCMQLDQLKEGKSRAMETPLSSEA